MCILCTTRLRIGVVSQPFCVDQLNPVGFNVFDVPYKENSRFFPTRETGNLKLNMAEADLSPTTFTSSTASDSDYDISLRIPLKMKMKIYTHTLKLPVIIIIRPRKQDAKPKVCRSSAMSKPINWIKLSSRRSGQTTENNLQKMAACPESEEAIQRVLTRTKRRTVAVTTNRK